MSSSKNSNQSNIAKKRTGMILRRRNPDSSLTLVEKHRLKQEHIQPSLPPDCHFNSAIHHNNERTPSQSSSSSSDEEEDDEQGQVVQSRRASSTSTSAVHLITNGRIRKLTNVNLITTEGAAKLSGVNLTVNGRRVDSNVQLIMNGRIQVLSGINLTTADNYDPNQTLVRSKPATVDVKKEFIENLSNNFNLKMAAAPSTAALKNLASAAPLKREELTLEGLLSVEGIRPTTYGLNVARKLWDAQTLKMHHISDTPNRKIIKTIAFGSDRDPDKEINLRKLALLKSVIKKKFPYIVADWFTEWIKIKQSINCGLCYRDGGIKKVEPASD